MKKRMLLVVAGLLVLLTAIVTPAFAGDYVVQPGDTMSKIFGSSWTIACSVNKKAGRVKNCDKIQPGQRLVDPRVTEVPKPITKPVAQKKSGRPTAPIEIDGRFRHTENKDGSHENKANVEFTQWQSISPDNDEYVGVGLEGGYRHGTWETERSFGTSDERSLQIRGRWRKYQKQCRLLGIDFDSCWKDFSLGLKGVDRHSDWTSKRSGKSGRSPEGYAVVNINPELTGYKGKGTGKLGLYGQLQIATENPDKNVSGIGPYLEGRYQATDDIALYARIDHWMSRGSKPYTTPEIGVRIGGTKDVPAVQLGIGKTLQNGAKVFTARINSGPIDAQARFAQHQKVGDNGITSVAKDMQKSSSAHHVDHGSTAPAQTVASNFNYRTEAPDSVFSGNAFL